MVVHPDGSYLLLGTTPGIIVKYYLNTTGTGSSSSSSSESTPKFVNHNNSFKIPEIYQTKNHHKNNNNNLKSYTQQQVVEDILETNYKQFNSINDSRTFSTTTDVGDDDDDDDLDDSFKLNQLYQVHNIPFPFVSDAMILQMVIDPKGDDLYVMSDHNEVIKIDLVTMKITHQFTSSNSTVVPDGRGYFCNDYIYLIQQDTGLIQNFYAIQLDQSLNVVNSLPFVDQQTLKSSVLDCENNKAYLFFQITTFNYQFYVARVDLSDISKIELITPTNSTIPFASCSFLDVYSEERVLYSMAIQSFNHYLLAYDPVTLKLLAQSPFMGIEPRYWGDLGCESIQTNPFFVAYSRNSKTTTESNRLGVTFIPQTNASFATGILYQNFWSINDYSSIFGITSYGQNTFLMLICSDNYYSEVITVSPVCKLLKLSSVANATSPLGYQLIGTTYFSFQSPSYNLIDMTYEDTQKYYISFVTNYQPSTYIDIIRVEDSYSNYISSANIQSVISLRLSNCQPIKSFQFNDTIYYFFGASIGFRQLMSVVIANFTDFSVSILQIPIKATVSSAFKPIDVVYMGAELKYHPPIQFFVALYSKNSDFRLSRLAITPTHSKILEIGFNVGKATQPYQVSHYETINGKVYVTGVHMGVYNASDFSTGPIIIQLSSILFIDSFYDSSRSTLNYLMYNFQDQPQTFQIYQLSTINNTIIQKSEPFQLSGTNNIQVSIVNAAGGFIDAYDYFGYFYLKNGLVITVKVGEQSTFYETYELKQSDLLTSVIFQNQKNNVYVLEPSGAIVLNLDCKIGYFRNKTSGYCQKCQAGFFSSEPGVVDCSQCIEGDVAPLPGSTQCSACPVGTQSQGGVNCTLCVGNTYTNNTGSTTCLPCPILSYSDSNHTHCVCNSGYYGLSTNCALCPDGGSCDNGTITLLPNYWSPYTNNTLIYPCPLVDSCLGINGSNCADGYYGIECAGCQDGWSLYINSCSKCPEHQYETYLVVAFFAFLLAIVLIIAYKSGVNVTFSAFKILISYGQVISSISVSITTNQIFLEKLLTLFTLSNLDLLHFLSLNCIFSRNVSFYESYWLTVSTPIIIIILVVLAHYSFQLLKRIYRLIVKKKRNRSKKSKKFNNIPSSGTPNPKRKYSLNNNDPNNNNSKLNNVELKISSDVNSLFGDGSYNRDDDDQISIDSGIEKYNGAVSIIYANTAPPTTINATNISNISLDDNHNTPMTLGSSYRSNYIDFKKHSKALYQNLQKLNKTLKVRHPSRDALWRDILLILLLCYSAVCQSVLSLYSCIKIGNNYYLQYDPNTSCEGHTWTAHAYFGIVFVVLYPVGVPLLFFILLYLWRKKKLIDENKCKERLSLLYVGYTDSCWYWECLELVRKLLLTSAVSITIKGNSFGIFNKNTINAVVSLLALYLQQHFKPFNNSQNNWLQFNSLAMIYFIYFYLVVTTINPSSNISIRTLGTADSICLLALVGVVVVHGLILGILYAKKLIPEIKNILISIWEKINL
eukprot:gene2618-3243_t